MIGFRNLVFKVIEEHCGDRRELDKDHVDYGYITLKELKIDSIELSHISYRLSTITGMPITSEISNKWVTISDIENTLSDFFK